jgi:hypothetical protein
MRCCGFGVANSGLAALMRIRFRTLAILAALPMCLCAQSAHAAFGISAVVGATQLPGPPPPDVLPGSNEQPVGSPIPISTPIVFHEVLGGAIVPDTPTPEHPLANLGLDVDHDGSNVSAAPVVTSNVVNPLLISTLIPVGTQFNSYLFHFDPAGSPTIAIYDSTITFENPIIGVQLFSNGFNLQKPVGTPYQGTLEQGDSQVALNGGPPVTYYPGSANYPPLGLSSRGVEEDALQITISGTQLRLTGQAFGNEIDQVRILTAVPEPGSAIAWTMVFATACAGLVSVRRS